MSKKILIVDDEADTRTLIKMLLEREGYQVSTAKDGKEGINQLKKEKSDLVILDMFMPGMTGREMCEKIRKNPKIKGTKIVFLTISTFGAKGIEQLENLNVLDYIKKPIDINDFKKRIKRFA